MKIRGGGAERDGDEQLSASLRPANTHLAAVDPSLYWTVEQEHTGNHPTAMPSSEET
jgi:hypothetical protein